MCIAADLYAEVHKVVATDIDAVFMFHGVMSAGSELDFDLGMRVNFESTKKLLEALRSTCSGVRVIFTSSQAVYGGVIPHPVDESIHPTPESSYGAEKMMCEYLINEYHRRSFINGLILRLPTISVRPGKPTAAASSFLSGMIREPLQGKHCVIPVTDRSFQHWPCSPKTLVANLLHSLTISREDLPAFNRVLNAPGIGVSVKDMMDSLVRVGGKDKLQYLSEVDDRSLKPMLYSWPTEFDNAKALSLGYLRDTSFDEIVQDFAKTLSGTSSSISGRL
ncbi:putative secondary metabolism biosynthetic enzyme [Lecanicillium sp. MT-2017a]|nr:putative secondary metabolism biosynthetic enzyme [Lecanicillium sp. MT-2017a]